MASRVRTGLAALGVLIALAFAVVCGPALASGSDPVVAVVVKASETALPAGGGVDRPCSGRVGLAGNPLCRVPASCLSVCGGLPAAGPAVPSPMILAGGAAWASDLPVRGIASAPDLPPPRPSV
jgi:hypothetical protein